MYNNWFAQLIMSMQDGSTIWGPFIWYDMFTWQGLSNWFWDAISMDILFLWELIKALVRDGGGEGIDWTWL